MKYLHLTLIAFFILFNLNAQVGIGTVTPAGILELKSQTEGFIPPRINLTATNIDLPVTNPQGGNLVPGTMVYNLNTSTGTYAVYPGVYFWDGGQWISMNSKAFKQEFYQTGILKTNALNGYENIPGLTNVTFTAPRDGTYQIISLGYYSIEGALQTFGEDEMGWGEGTFRLSVNGLNIDKYSHAQSFSDSNSITGDSQDMYLLYNETTLIHYVTLHAGDSCTLSLTFDESDTYNLSFGNTGVIGNDPGSTLSNLCYVSAIYIGR